MVHEATEWQIGLHQIKTFLFKRDYQDEKTGHRLRENIFKWAGKQNMKNMKNSRVRKQTSQYENRQNIWTEPVSVHPLPTWDN